MPLVRIESLDDPRLSIYRDLKGNNTTRDLGLFIAEGTRVAERLFSSDYDVHSVLLSDKKFNTFGHRIPADVTVYRLRHDLARQLVGYSFHSGVLACGFRTPNPSLEKLMQRHKGPATFTIGPHIIDPENVGALIRIGAAFGSVAILFGSKSADPFSRRALRVSMGNGLFVPVIHSPKLASLLRQLREQWNVRLVATVLDPKATLLPSAPRPERVGLMFGNETDGLTPDWTDLADDRVTIPMQLSTDSLNVAIASGIFLYEYSR